MEIPILTWYHPVCRLILPHGAVRFAFNWLDHFITQDGAVGERSKTEKQTGWLDRRGTCRARSIGCQTLIAVLSKLKLGASSSGPQARYQAIAGVILSKEKE
jgi:hypothetical protein